MLYLLSVVVIIFISCTLAQNQQVIHRSPCPDIFAYRRDGSTWKGEIILKKNLQQENINLDVELSIRASIGGVSQYIFIYIKF